MKYQSPPLNGVYSVLQYCDPPYTIRPNFGGLRISVWGGLHHGLSRRQCNTTLWYQSRLFSAVPRWTVKSRSTHMQMCTWDHNWWLHNSWVLACSKMWFHSSLFFGHCTVCVINDKAFRICPARRAFVWCSHVSFHQYIFLAVLDEYYIIMTASLFWLF